MKKLMMLAVLLALAGAALASTAPAKLSLFEPEVVTETGRMTDHLYSVIMAIVIVMFVLTEGMLVLSIILFRDRPGHKARFFHGSTSVELVLAGIPTLILIYLTYASGVMWSDLKIHDTKDKDTLHVQVFCEQFAWNFRYAGADKAFGTADDVVSFNNLALPVNRTVTMHISAKDVIHSFFIPEARVKQDAVPGLLTKMWFKIDHLPVWDLKNQKRLVIEEKEYAAQEVAVAGYDFKSEVKKGKGKPFQMADSKMINLLDYSYVRNSDPLAVVKGGQAVKASGEPALVRHHYEIGCAQLCGTSHFAMRGEVQVMTAAEFERWLAGTPADSELASKWAIWDKFHPDFNRI